MKFRGALPILACCLLIVICYIPGDEATPISAARLLDLRGGQTTGAACTLPVINPGEGCDDCKYFNATYDIKCSSSGKDWFCEASAEDICTRCLISADQPCTGFNVLYTKGCRLSAQVTSITCGRDYNTAGAGVNPSGSCPDGCAFD